MTAKANAKCKVGDPVRWNSVGHFNRSMEDFLPLLARGEAVIVVDEDGAVRSGTARMKGWISRCGPAAGTP